MKQRRTAKKKQRKKTVVEKKRRTLKPEDFNKEYPPTPNGKARGTVKENVDAGNNEYPITHYNKTDDPGKCASILNRSNGKRKSLPYHRQSR